MAERVPPLGHFQLARPWARFPQSRKQFCKHLRQCGFHVAVPQQGRHLLWTLLDQIVPRPQIRFEQFDESIQTVEKEGNQSPFERSIRRWSHDDVRPTLPRRTYSLRYIRNDEANMMRAASIAHKLADRRYSSR